MLRGRVILTILLAAIALQGFAAQPTLPRNVRPWIERLDSALSQASGNRALKEQKITRLKNSLVNARKPERRYELLSNIYEEYKTFNPDSALKYARDAESISARIFPGSIEHRYEWILNKAYIYSASGVFPKAEDLIETINPALVPQSLKTRYYSDMEYYYSHYALFAAADQNTAQDMQNRAKTYLDSLGYSLRAGNQDYLWWPIAASNTKVSDSIYNVLRHKVDKSAMNTRQDAINAYWTAVEAERRGDNASYVEYLTKSAIADVLSSNRDIASLQELANYLFEQGDITRPYRYISYCMDQAQEYHNRIRMVSLARINTRIHQSYLHQIETQDRNLHLLLVISLVLCLLMGVAVYLLIRQMRKLRRMHNELESANSQLKTKIDELDSAHREILHASKKEKELIEQLRSINSELQEANSVKEKYIVYCFSLAAKFIDDLDALRKKLLRRAKSSQYAELKADLESSSLVQNEVNQFYKTFDATFLSLYPDFIDEYNSEYPPEEHVQAKHGELPNTRLRIHALHKLGITESSKIAKMLRCSIQTVYNNRPRKRT